jgi:hypothetical protein
MKKILVTIIALAVTLCVGAAFIPTGGVASAMELTGDECDTVFIENINELAAENYSGDLTISATKELLYDIDSAPLGFVYDFTVNGESGYAIVINTAGVFDAAEFFFDAQNPYADVTEGERIYVGNMIYLRRCDNEYYFVGSDVPLSDELLDTLKEKAYRMGEGGVITTSSEYIYYTYRSENKYEMAKRYPGLTEVGGLSNACAPIAGGNIVQYWDRYDTNLISDYTPGVYFGSYYLYKEVSQTLNSVITQLYNDMGTNSGDAGTSITQFRNGLTTYCNRQGYYTVSFNSCMNNGSFDYNAAKTLMSQGQPLALFLDVYTVIDITANDGYDYLLYDIGDGCHVMAGFGYKEITYTLSGGSSRTDYYIAVASGLSMRKRGYFNINYSTQIDQVYGISIA